MDAITGSTFKGSATTLCAGGTVQISMAIAGLEGLLAARHALATANTLVRGKPFAGDAERLILAGQRSGIVDRLERVFRAVGASAEPDSAGGGARAVCPTIMPTNGHAVDRVSALVVGAQGADAADSRSGVCNPFIVFLWR